MLIMFRTINDPKGRMIFLAIIWMFVLEETKCQFVDDISMISCEFDASQCGWRPFREKSDWILSNSSQDSDIPDNGQNFLLLRGTSIGAKVSMIISPHFRILPRKISLKQRIYCSGSPILNLHFSDVISSTMDILTGLRCSKDEAWEETEQNSEAQDDDEDEFNPGFQILLVGTVKAGDVIAIQDVRIIDDTVDVTGSTTTPHDNETETTLISTVNDSTNTTTSATGEDVQSTSDINSTYTEIYHSSGSPYITENHQNDTTTVSPDDKSTESNTREPPLTKNTSTEENVISTLTAAQNYTDSPSNVTEDIFTEDNISNSSIDLGNQTDNTSVSPQINSSSSQSEDGSEKTSTSASTEIDSTSVATTDSVKTSLILQNDRFLWRTVFISTLTAFCVYSLLSILISVIRKLIRRRKQWTLGKRSKDDVMSAEDREVIPMTVFSKV